MAGAGNCGVGVVAEIKSAFEHFVTVYFGFSARAQLADYSPVFFQDQVNITDNIIGFAVLPVVIIVSALVGTELFI